MAARRPATKQVSRKEQARQRKLDRPRRTEVVQQAAEVFAELGYEAATIQDVADRLGMLKGSLYYYIDNKEDLLEAFITDTYEELADYMLTPVREAAGTGLERAGEYVKRNALMNTRHLTAAAVLSGDFRSISPALWDKMIQERRRHDQFLTELLQQGQEDGSIRAELDPQFAATSILAMCNAIYRWYRPGGRLSPAEIAEMTWDLVGAGLASR